jgi:hypothetical protein
MSQESDVFHSTTSSTTYTTTKFIYYYDILLVLRGTDRAIPPQPASFFGPWEKFTRFNSASRRKRRLPGHFAVVDCQIRSRGKPFPLQKRPTPSETTTMMFALGWGGARPSRSIFLGGAMIAFLALGLLVCGSMASPTTSIIRQLEIGDFDRFNTLFKDAFIKLNDQSITSGELTLVVSNLQCSDIQIGDVQLDYTVADDVNGTNASVLAVTISASPFSMTCTADYSYDFTFLSGSGTFESTTVDNSVNSTINLIAPNGFDMEVPSLSEVAACASQVNVDQTVFEGGIVSVVLNLFESAVSDVIANQANIGSFAMDVIHLSLCYFALTGLLFLLVSCL